MNELKRPLFRDEARARAWLERHAWPDGPICPRCDVSDVTRLTGSAHRRGLYQCNSCRRQFTVTVGTIFERTKVPLDKWLIAIFVLTASTRRIETRRLSWILGVSYKTAWSMRHRIRQSLRRNRQALFLR